MITFLHLPSICFSGAPHGDSIKTRDECSRLRSPNTRGVVVVLVVTYVEGGENGREEKEPLGLGVTWTIASLNFVFLH